MKIETLNIQYIVHEKKEIEKLEILLKELPLE